MGRYSRLLIAVLLAGLLAAPLYISAQGFDYWILQGPDCDTAISYSGSIGSINSGYEAYVIATGSFGTVHTASSYQAAPGSETGTATVLHYICPYNRSTPYWIAYNLHGEAEGGYIVTYNLDVKNNPGTITLDEDSDSEGGGGGACLSISGTISGTAAAPTYSSYYYGLYLRSQSSVNSSFCAEDGEATSSYAFSLHESVSPTPTPEPGGTATPTPIIHTQYLTLTTGTWTIPGPLVPITYSLETDSPHPWGEGSVITRDLLWWVARVALTIYSILPGSVWFTFFFVLLITPIGLILYKLMLEPPDL